MQLFVGVMIFLVAALMAGTGGWILRSRVAKAPAAMALAQPDLAGGKLAELEHRLVDAERVIAGLKGARPSFFSNEPPALPDDLCVISGVDALTQSMLYNLGVHTYGQLAQLTAEDVAYVAARMEIPPARIEDQLWVQQAMTLATLHGQSLGGPDFG